MAASSSSSSSSSGAADAATVATPATRMKRLAADESCSLLAPDATRGCRAARSCASCLETTGCMISTIGRCVSPLDVAYNQTIDYRNAVDQRLDVTDAEKIPIDDRLRAPQTWQFRAGTVRYCRAGDAACDACVRSNFWRPNQSFPDSRFCLGDGGDCVCVDVCERRWYVSDDCSGAATPMPGYYLTSENVAERLWRGLLGMGLFVVIVLLVMLRNKRATDALQRAREAERDRQREARRARRHARSRELGVDPLTLSGWETFRRDLIDKEAAQLAGKNDESKTSEVLHDVNDESSEGDAQEIRSPRHEPSTAYVNLEESEPDGRASRPAAPASRHTSREDTQRARAAAYNEATPGRQLLAPIRDRSYRASM